MDIYKLQPNIKDLIGDMLSKFKVYNSPQLFDTDDFISLLKQKRCPLCTNKLHLLRYRPTYMCTGKKHAKPFMIAKDKLEKLSPLVESKICWLLNKLMIG